MARLNQQEKDIVRTARRMIKDLEAGWAIKELSTTPDNMCRQLSELVGDKKGDPDDD